MQVTFAFDPARYRFITFRQKHDGRWEAFFGAAFEVRDTQGSSLGSIHATGFGATPQEAVDASLHNIEAQIAAEIVRSETRPETKGISPAQEAEDLFNLLDGLV